MSTTRLRVFTAALVAVLGFGLGAPAQAQTINGRLMEVDIDRVTGFIVGK